MAAGMPEELELKFRIPEDVSANALLGAAAEFAEEASAVERIVMRTSYYDTADMALSRLKITLRRRMENGVSVVCVKQPISSADGFFRRGEWETESDDPIKALPALIHAGAPETLGELMRGGIIERCGAAFVRLSVMLRTGDDRAELSVDEGELFGGNRRAPFREAEIEAKGCGGEYVERLGCLLSEKFGLSPEPVSKQGRALTLAAAGAAKAAVIEEN